MISHRHKCIFIHLRRTAGNSIEHALGGITLFDRDGKETQTWDEALHSGRKKFKIDNRGHYLHDNAIKIRNAFPVEFENYFKFSIVRNPWSQMLSIYFKRKKKGSTEAAFGAFLADFDSLEGTTARHTLNDADGHCLVDFVGRFENLAGDFELACREAGIDGVHLPHLNATSREDYRDYYDADSRRRVEEIFGEDIERYGYRF